MLQERPQTSTCIHSFFGVRFGVSEIALSAYPNSRFAANYEICAMAAAGTARAIRIRGRDSNSRCSRLLLLLFRAWSASVQPAARESGVPRSKSHIFYRRASFTIDGYPQAQVED